MDLMMPGMDGVEASAKLHRRFPAMKILILTTYGSANGIASALNAGTANRAEAVAIALRKHLLKI